MKWHESMESYRFLIKFPFLFVKQSSKKFGIGISNLVCPLPRFLFKICQCCSMHSLAQITLSSEILKITTIYFFSLRIRNSNTSLKITFFSKYCPLWFIHFCLYSNHLRKHFFRSAWEENPCLRNLICTFGNKKMSGNAKLYGEWPITRLFYNFWLFDEVRQLAGGITV